MFGNIKKILTVLITNIVNASNQQKCLSMGNQKCVTQPTLINSHLYEYSQDFHYYPFAVKLDKCAVSCNAATDLSNKVCIPNKTENLNLSVSKMITEKNESKNLTEYISCKCKCKLDGRKPKSNQKWNDDKCQYEHKTSKHHACQSSIHVKKIILEIENGKYLTSIIDNNSVITFDEVTDAKTKWYHDETKTAPTDFNKKNITCKT